MIAYQDRHASLEGLIDCHAPSIEAAGDDAQSIAWETVLKLCGRERADEVDFVLSQGERLTAIEVKSGRDKGQYPGLKHFTSNYKLSKPLVVGTGGVPLTEFLLSKPEQWL